MASECTGCGYRVADFTSAVDTAFDLTGELYCGECAAAVLEDNSQFGVGA